MATYADTDLHQPKPLSNQRRLGEPEADEAQKRAVPAQPATTYTDYLTALPVRAQGATRLPIYPGAPLLFVFNLTRTIATIIHSASFILDTVGIVWADLISQCPSDNLTSTNTILQPHAAHVPDRP